MISYEQNTNDIDADEEDENASVHVRYRYDFFFYHFTVIVIFRSDWTVWQDCTSYLYVRPKCRWFGPDNLIGLLLLRSRISLPAW